MLDIGWSYMLPSYDVYGDSDGWDKPTNKLLNISRWPQRKPWVTWEDKIFDIFFSLCSISEDEVKLTVK